MFAGIGAGFQLAFHRRFRQHIGIRHQRIDRVDGLVQVVFERVEVAVVGVGDLGWDVALRDSIHVTSGHVERADDGIERVVNPGHNLLEVALVFAGIGAGFQLAFHRRFRQHIGIRHQRIDRVDGLVQVVFQGIKVAVVSVGDLRWNVAFRDAIDITSRYVQRPNDSIERVIDAGHDFLEVALMLVCIGSGF